VRTRPATARQSVASWQRGVQKQADVADVAQALARILLETVLDERPYGGRYAVQVRFVLDDVRKDVSHLVGLEQSLASEHLVQDDAECPDVGAAIDRLAPRLLGTHVGGRAEHDADARVGGCCERRRLRKCRPDCARLDGHELGEAEVEHLHRAVWAHLDIGRLQIAMRLEWFSAASVFASRSRRASRAASAAIDSGKTLIATFRARFVSVA